MIVPALAAVMLGGCLAYRPPVALDAPELAELESIRARLRADDVRVVAPFVTDWYEARMTLLALEEVRILTYRSTVDPRPTDVVLDVRRVRDAGDAGSLWGGVLSMLTLGVVPYFDDRSISYAIRWSSADAATADGVYVVATETVSGWFAPFFAIRDGWRLGRVPGAGSPEHRAASARLGLALARQLDAFVGPGGGAR